MPKADLRTSSKKAINILLGILMGAGFCCLGVSALAHFLRGIGIHGVSSSIQFPIGGLTWMGADRRGRVYCYDNTYVRLQIYSSQGRFIRGWFDQGGFWDLDSNDETIHVVDTDDKNIKYDHRGNILDVWIERGSYKKHEAAAFDEEGYQEVSFEDTFGNLYELQSRFFSTKIARITSNGERSIIIEDPLYLWLIRTPFPAWLYMGLPMAVWATRDLLRKRQKKRGKNEANQPNQ